MALAPGDLAELAKLLREGLTLPTGQRESWYGALPACGLKPMLGALLREHALDSAHHAFATLPKLGRDAVPADIETAAGEQVGPFRLLEELGRGGMGSVWLAERIDGHPRRPVALKLPRYAWGFGLAERMRRERDLAARLEHPHIARLYEAGFDDNGRPYLAFEYIAGTSIERWCASRQLGVDERLRLFTQVARAVAYAHARLVVHRDLKPSNILVSEDGQVHLLDFGIAKSLSEADAEQPALTQWMGAAMTPVYASPEQLAGESITIASDIYSLGVVLFELLTGHLPQKTRRRGTSAMQEAIFAGDLPSASASVDDRQLSRSLKGEVDAIVAKALRADPTQRYATAIAMAEDIERHLSGDRVLAQADSTWYRWRRIAKRHGPALALGVGGVAALATAAGIALAQARRANAEAAAASAVKGFVLDVFHVNGKDNPANAQLRQLPVELLLERGAKKIELGFAGQPALRAELHGEMAAVFLDMASYRLAAEQARLQVDALDHDRAAPSERAAARLRLARALANDERLAEAEPMAREALSLAAAGDFAPPTRLALCEVLIRAARYDEAAAQLDTVFASPALSTDQGLHLAALALRADLLRWTNRLGHAVPLYEQVIRSSIERDGPLSSLAIDTRIKLANALINVGDVDDGKRHLAEALRSMRTMGGDADIAAAMTEARMVSIGSYLWSRPFEETEADFLRLHDTLSSHGRTVPEVLRAWMDFHQAKAYYSHNEVERAYALGRPAIELLLTRTESAEQRARLWNLLDSVAMETGRHDEADRFARSAKLEIERAMGSGSAAAASGSLDVAMNLSMVGRFDEAVAELQLVPPSSPTPSGAMAEGRAHVAHMLSLQRVQIEIDRGDYAAALRMMPADAGPVPPPPGWDPKLYEGRARCGAGDTGRGLPIYEAALARLAPRRYPHSHWLAWDRANLGLCALHAGQVARAKELAALAREAFRQHPGVSPYFKRPSVQLDELLKKRL